MNDKTKIKRAAIILVIGTVTAKVLGFMRELVVAYKFGASSITDAFVLTNGIPSLIFVSIGTAIGINYIPCFQRIETIDEKNKFTSNLLNIIIVILLSGCFVVECCPDIILKIFAIGISDETRQYAIVMLRIVMIAIFPIIISHLFQAYSQANGIFVTTAFFGVATNIVIIIITVLASEKNYWILSVGTVLANTIGMGVVIWGSRKGGFHYCPMFHPHDRQIKRLVSLSLPLIIEDIASSMSLIVDRNLASLLDSGTIAGLNYAGTLGNIAGTMISGSVITAVFPTFSKLNASNDKRAFEAAFRKSADIMLFFLCPVAMMMTFFAKDIVVFIFQHGAFNSSASKIVWESMACYGIGIIPSGMQSYLIRAFYSLQETKIPVKVKVFALMCNIGLNVITVQKWRHIGIALSTSISLIISYVLLSFFLDKKFRIGAVRLITKEMIVNSTISLFSGIISYVIFERCILIDSLFFKLMLELGGFLMCYIGFNAMMRMNTVKGIIKILKE